MTHTLRQSRRGFLFGFFPGLLALTITRGPAHADPAPIEPPVMVSVPANLAVGDIIVSLKDRRLYHVRERGRARAYPIATPRDDDLWHGSQTVTMKREWPSWRPTESMLQDNPRLPRFVPGKHPLNPMGARALYLGHSYYRIHGTDAPWLIGQNVSKGCIRMHNAHVIELFDNVAVGTRVTVIQVSLADPGKRTVDGARPVRGT